LKEFDRPLERLCYVWMTFFSGPFVYLHNVQVSPFPCGMIRCLAVTTDGCHVCVGHSTGTLSILDLRTGSLVSAWKGHEQEVRSPRTHARHLLAHSSWLQSYVIVTIHLRQN
jgi:hypothetical protein